jgi:hypothetical protein
MNPRCRQREAYSVHGENGRYRNERQKENEDKMDRRGDRRRRRIRKERGK